MRRLPWALAVVLLLLPFDRPHAQEPAKLEFDVVSIKPNTSDETGGYVRSMPGGGTMASNVTMLSFIGSASPVPVLLNNIVGLPDWVSRERYDVIAKAPAGASSDDVRAMWQNVFATRMKLVAHIEQRESNVFALVLARKDGKLGPELKKSTLHCNVPPEPGAPPPPPPQRPSDFAGRCGMMGNGTSIVTGGMTMDMLARNVSGRAGGPVENRTGLDGYYAFTLTFSPPGRGAQPDALQDAPDFFTALQEQLGLKLESSKGTVPYFVIDHIERPTED